MTIQSKLVETLANLKPGDVIIVHPDEGSPAIDRERALVVWKKLDAGGVLTTDGTAVSPQYNSEVIYTGVRIEKIVPSLQGKAAWMQIQAQMDVPRDLENFDSEPE